MLNPVHLRTLEVVTETGSFAAAARELGYTASAVSQQMEALERASGMRLFDREARGVKITEMARMLTERARGVLAELYELDADVRGIATGRTGRLRVGCFPTAGARILPSALSNLRETHPAVEVSLRIGEPKDTVPMIESGELDIAFTYEYAALQQRWSDAVVEKPLIVEDLVFLSPSDEGIREATDIERASTLQWISSGAGTAGELTMYRICADMGFVPELNLRTEYYDLITEFVGAGLGVAIVPALGILDHPTVSIVPLHSPWARRTVALVHRVNPSNPLIPVVVDSFVETVTTHDWGRYVTVAAL